MLNKSQQVGSVVGIALYPAGGLGGHRERQPLLCAAETLPGSFSQSLLCRLCARWEQLFKQIRKWFARKNLRTLENIHKAEQVRELAGVPGVHQELGHFWGTEGRRRCFSP